MKTRFPILLALAMAFVLMMASVAAAAPGGETISNELELNVTVTEEQVVEPTIEVNDDLATISAEGLYDCFTVSTSPGDSGNETVRVKMVASPASGFELEYVEQNPDNANYGKYLPLDVDESGEAWFGPSTGFPLAAVADSMFRVTWNQTDTYEFTVSIMGGDGFGDELATTTATVTVVDANAIALTHAIGNGDLSDDSITTDVIRGDEMTHKVKAQLNNGVGHVDHALYIIEVTKEDAINLNDFTIVGNPEGIQDTFEVVDVNTVKGHWGPPAGFTFAEETTTSMDTVFNSDGTYGVSIYAIQVEPAAEANLKQ